MRAGAGDEHTLRIEQRSELRFRGPGTSSGARLVDVSEFAELHERIDGQRRPVGGDDQGIDVDAEDVGSRGDQCRQSEQHCLQLLAIDWQLATKRAEQLLRRQSIDHLGCVEIADRRRPELHVGERLGDDAADTEHDVGAELRIAYHPGDQLAIARDHRGDQQRHLSISRRRLGQEINRRGLHGGAVGKPQAHQASLGLVRDCSATQLRHHRVAECLRGLDSPLRCRHLTLVGHGHAVRAQQRLRCGFRQGVWSAHTRHARRGRCLGDGFSSGYYGTRAVRKKAVMWSRRRNSASAAKGSSSSRPPRNGESEK